MKSAWNDEHHHKSYLIAFSGSFYPPIIQITVNFIEKQKKQSQTYMQYINANIGNLANAIENKSKSEIYL